MAEESLIPALAAAAPTPPLAFVGRQAWPLLGIYYRLKAIITDPTGLAVACRRKYGDVFTIRIPFNFDLTYVVSRDAYRQVLGLDASVGRMGPVMGNVPTVGYWFRRDGDDHASLQELMLVGRSFMGSYCLERRRQEAARAGMLETLQSHVARWEGEVDLGGAVWRAVYDAAIRGMVGDELWRALGPEAAADLRAIADGIDIVRVTLSVTPFHWFMREYRATRRLQARLEKLVREHRAGRRFEFIDALSKLEPGGKPISDNDIAWTLMYVLWNAVTYPGSYTFWSLVDVVSTPSVLAEARRDPGSPERTRLLEYAFFETLRLNPVASLVRSLSRPVEVEASGRRWTVPAETYLGVLPYEMNRDATEFPEPDRYDPMRYRDGRSKVPQLFGRGAFGCVAQNFSTFLVTQTLELALDRYDWTFVDELPDRLCRVHLVYPSGPVRARAVRRQATKEAA